MSLSGTYITRKERFYLPKYTDFVDAKGFDFYSYYEVLFSLQLVAGKIQLYKDNDVGYTLSLYSDFGDMSPENYEKALETVTRIYCGSVEEN